jgi:regulator of sigma E protease
MSVKELSGPLGIAKVSGDKAREGISNLSELIAILSVNVGFFNILPIPALDGGHLLLVVIEGLRRRPLSTKVKLWIQQIGIVLLLALMAVVVFNDFTKLR